MADSDVKDVEQGNNPGLDRPKSQDPPKEERTFVLRLTTLFKFQKTKRRRANLAEEEKVIFGLLTKDQFFMIKAALGLTFEGFKVVMATLLSLFVPQRCPADPDRGLFEDHSCTDQENLGLAGTPLTDFENFVLVWNFLTLAFAIFHYLLVYRREKFIIEYLEEDPMCPDNHLPHVLKEYKSIDKDLYKFNLFVLVSSVWVITLFTINAIVSGVMIFRDYFDNYRTATVWLTNVALMFTIMEKTFQHSWAGLQDRVALSCIDFTARNFNVIDPAYKDPVLEEKIEQRIAAQRKHVAPVVELPVMEDAKEASDQNGQVSKQEDKEYEVYQPSQQ